MAGVTLLYGGNIANIELVKIETEGTDPKTYYFETANSAKFVPSVSAGTEKEQRIKNRIMGLIKTDDIVKGYDITLEDDRLIEEIYALVDGGSYTEGASGAGAHYTGQVAGSPVTRKRFTMTLYSSDRDSDGEALKYHAWKFPTCKGKPVEGSMTDGDFAKLSYTIESRPANGVASIDMTELTKLPTEA